MRVAGSIFFFLFSIAVAAQVNFKTIVPRQPVVAGESFRVQYVVENAEVVNHLIPPAFTGFRFVSGPEVYTGLSADPGRRGLMKNTIYTLEALEPGRYQIPGALAGINGKNYRSNDVWIEVISRSQAEKLRRENGAATDNTAYFLRPGEDPYEKIRQNMFVKVLLSKKACYSGEAVVATFKLYSRLESKSEIVKNPGFYGFTVHDMIGLADKVMASETVNGKIFDVHTIRQVQLYPLQSGSFTIDAMEINNKVEFSRSTVSKKTEQQIAEGISGEDNDGPSPGTEIFESSIRTEPVVITVKPTPVKNKPADFTGATGRFSIETKLEKKELAKNEEGLFVVTIKGKGNFSQLSAPVIEWPAGIEGFDPVVTEILDKTSSPLKGQKTFRYPFVSSKAGEYSLLPVSFSFFDPDTNTYRTVSAPAVRLNISNKEKDNKTIVQGTKKRSIVDVNRKASLVAAGIVIFFVLLVLLYWVSRKKEPVRVNTTIQEPIPVIIYPSAEDILKPAFLQLHGHGRDFYSSLYHSLWNHLAQQFSLSGTEINKQTLAMKLEQQGFTGKDELLEILQHCEAGMFTNAALEDDREELLQRVQLLLEQLRT